MKNGTVRKIIGTPWGERSRLIDKAMVYAFSLEQRALSKGPYLTIMEAKPKPEASSDEYGVRHLFGETIVTMPEGLRCDVPRGYVEGGDGEIGESNDRSSCWLNMRIRSSLDSGNARLYFAVNGVVNFDGGLSAFRNPLVEELAGEAFFSSVQEASTTTYRWLERRQLFGVGRVAGRREVKAESGASRKLEREPLAAAAQPDRDEWVLDFSFDLYAAL